MAKIREKIPVDARSEHATHVFRRIHCHRASGDRDHAYLVSEFEKAENLDIFNRFRGVLSVNAE